MTTRRHSVAPRQKLRGAWLIAVAISVAAGLLVAHCAPVAATETLLEQFFSGIRVGSDPAEPASDDPPPALETSPTNQPNQLRPSDNGPVVGGAGAPGDLLPPVAPQEFLPTPRERFHVPLADIGSPGKVEISKQMDGRVSLVVRDASLSRVLSMFAQSMKLNIVAANDIDAVVSITLHEVPVGQALSAILSVANYTWVEQNGIIYVTSTAAGSALPANVQGRQIQVFPLDYASATDVATAVQGFLSPVGQVFTHESAEDDNRKTRETVVVEDLPQAIARIAAFIGQIDQPPPQVEIEAHILQVDLKDDDKHGVNFDHMFDVMGNSVSLRTVGFANAASTQAFFASVTGGNLTSLVELLKATTDVKTLASPKITVLNEQTAKIHIGEQLGYRVTTTTETSSLESVDFLDVGVVLSITPRISRDNRVLLNVKPEVSSGQINPETGVPEEETTELETSIMLENGYGMVIGGLIKETDSVIESKIPYLGDLRFVGLLFQHKETVKDRSEIIIVLVPRVLPHCGQHAAFEQGEVARSETQLFEGPLLRKSRPWLPKLPDAVSNPRILRFPPVGQNYPYPAERIDYAGTPQPQRNYPTPAHPEPRFQPFGPCDAPYCLPEQTPFFDEGIRWDETGRSSDSPRPAGEPSFSLHNPARPPVAVRTHRTDGRKPATDGQVRFARAIGRFRTTAPSAERNPKEIPFRRAPVHSVTR